MLRQAERKQCYLQRNFNSEIISVFERFLISLNIKHHPIQGYCLAYFIYSNSHNLCNLHLDIIIFPLYTPDSILKSLPCDESSFKNVMKEILTLTPPTGSFLTLGKLFSLSVSFHLSIKR